jgi:hypothetical protein
LAYLVPQYKGGRLQSQVDEVAKQIQTWQLQVAMFQV